MEVADKAHSAAKRYSGHSLRHGFATTAAEAGASVQAIDPPGRRKHHYL